MNEILELIDKRIEHYNRQFKSLSSEVIDDLKKIREIVVLNDNSKDNKKKTTNPKLEEIIKEENNVVSDEEAKEEIQNPEVKEQQEESIEDLRKEYERIMGKKPFNGWNIKQLKEKMNK